MKNFFRNKHVSTKKWARLTKFNFRKECPLRKIDRKIRGVIDPFNILIVDSHIGVQELLKEEFESENYRVRATGEAVSVPELIRTWHPEIVILDPFLKGENRWDLLRLIKARFPHTPVLIVTAYAGLNDMSDLSEADGCVIKSSACIDELKEKVAAILKTKVARSAQFETRRYFPQMIPAHRAGNLG